MWQPFVAVAPVLPHLLATWAIATSAQAAPTVATDLDCYQQDRQVTLRASGFAAGAMYTVLRDGRQLGSGTVELDGTVDGSFSSGRLPRGVLERTFELQVGDGVTAATRRFRVTRFLAGFTPRKATPETRVRFNAYGFGRLARVYVHYVRPSGGVAKTVYLGRGRGPCGKITSTAERTLFPFRPSPGRWRLQFDIRRTYDPRAVPRLVRPLTVKRASRR